MKTLVIKSRGGRGESVKRRRGMEKSKTTLEAPLLILSNKYDSYSNESSNPQPMGTIYQQP
jgi:hypothetical protein